jgi:hypothetical protein
VNGLSKFWAVVLLVLLLVTATNVSIALYELQRWQQRDREFMENRRRIERLESLMLERGR